MGINKDDLRIPTIPKDDFPDDEDDDTELCPQCHQEVSPMLIHCNNCGYCLTCNL